MAGPGKTVFDAVLTRAESARRGVFAGRRRRARKRDLWWPFTQHNLVGDVCVIDSRRARTSACTSRTPTPSRPGAVHLRFRRVGELVDAGRV